MTPLPAALPLGAAASTDTAHPPARTEWLGPDRARLYGTGLAVVVGIQALHLLWRLLHSAAADPSFRPEPTDFDAFWSASWLTLHHHAQLAYSVPALKAAERIGAQPDGAKFLPFLYPPAMLLLCAPLALLAYLPSMAAFTLGSYAAACACLRRLLPPAWPAWPVLAFPAAMLNATIGQTAFLSTLCFAGAALLLELRPILAGACLGCLVFKPHLAICVPVALLAAGRNRALAAAAATALGLLLASWALLGSATWAAFLAAAPVLGQVLAAPDVWPKLLSTLTAIRLLHGGILLAAIAQAAATLAAIACTAAVARRRPGGAAEVATLVAAAVLATPYLLDYDLVLLAVPMAWIAGRGSTAGWHPHEKLLLAALYVAPLFLRQLNEAAGLPLAPLLLGALLACTARRALDRPA